jgi:hypothetical protein
MAMRVRRGAFLVVVATMLGACAAGCGGSAHSGAVLLTVTLPADVQVQAAGYTLDDEVNPPVRGTVSAPRPQSQLDKLIPHVPSGYEYGATVNATSPDGQKACEGSASFKVTRDATTRVQVALTCRGGRGQVVVGIGVSCRQVPLVSFVLSPLVAPVGTYVIGRAEGVRPDGGPLTFAWAAPSGTFASPTESQTTFTCTQVGPVEVTMKVKDDEACEQTYSAVVTCTEPAEGGRNGGDAGADGGPD